MTALATLPAAPVSAARRFSAVAHTVLLVDGDGSAREGLARVFERNNLAVIEVDSSSDGLRAVFDERPSAIVVHADLPDGGGWVMLERVRELCDLPVLMLHGHYDEHAVVRALRAGADDALAMPFGQLEALARVEALIRRHEQADPGPVKCYADALVEMNLANAEVRVDGREIRLTPLEMRLLWEFVQHPRQTLSADHLLESVWGGEVHGRDRLKLYVAYLRAKFRDAGAEVPIVTTRGFGYRYDPPA